MKGRDFVLVGAILAIGGLAVADVFRSGDGSGRPAEGGATAPPPPAVTLGEISLAQRFEALPLEGSIVLTDADDCRVRRMTMASGAEARLPRLAGDCLLWAAPVGRAIAYGLGGGRPDREPFRIVDLGSPGEPLGGYVARFGFLTWSFDGRRAAWCGTSGAGFDLELGGRARRLPDCPAAYTPGGEVAFARGNRVEVAGQAVVETDGGITAVHFGRNASVAVVVDGARVERWSGGELTGALDLPRRLHGRLPVFSPDNCAVFFRRPARIDLFSLGCFRGEAPRTFFDGRAAWSPDGRWIVVAEQRTVAFHRVVGPRDVLRWPVAAAQIAWQR